MSADPPVLKPEELRELVHCIIAETLVVSRNAVQPDTRLIQDLGAESIDFLDLVFRLEEALHRKIPVDRWEKFVRRRILPQDLAEKITTTLVIEFVEEELARSH